MNEFFVVGVLHNSSFFFLGVVESKVDLASKVYSPIRIEYAKTSIIFFKAAKPFSLLFFFLPIVTKDTNKIMEQDIVSADIEKAVTGI